MPYDTATPVLVDGPRVRVAFTGPGVPKVEDEAPRGANVEAWARDYVATLNKPRAKSTVVVGTPVDLTPPTPVIPVLTPKEAFERDALEVVKDKQHIDAGLFTPSDVKAKANSDKAKASRAAYLASEGL